MPRSCSCGHEYDQRRVTKDNYCYRCSECGATYKLSKRKARARGKKAKETKLGNGTDLPPEESQTAAPPPVSYEILSYYDEARSMTIYISGPEAERFRSHLHAFLQAPR